MSKIPLCELVAQLANALQLMGEAVEELQIKPGWPPARRKLAQARDIAESLKDFIHMDYQK